MMSRCLESVGKQSSSFGTEALFKWKGESGPDGEVGLCCLGHGDILVMDGQCQDVRMSSRSGTRTDQRYVPLDPTVCCILFFPKIRCCVLSANVCAGFFCSCCGVCGEWRLLGILGALGGGRWRHYLRDLFAHKFANCLLGNGSDSICTMPCMLPLVGQPSLHGCYARIVYWANMEHSGDNTGNMCFFCLVGILVYGFGAWCSVT